jgi:hypothetical protein
MFAAAPAHALLVNMQNFNSLADFTLNGVTATIDTGGMGVVGPNVGDERVLRLTNNYAQSGSAFLTNAISLASDASFELLRVPVHQPGRWRRRRHRVHRADRGQHGRRRRRIGYDGLANSVGVEFDNWDNGPCDGNNGNHAGINLAGSVCSVVRADTLPAQLDSGSIFHAWVDYNGVTDSLEVRLALNDTRPAAALMSYTVDLVSVLGTTNAFVGFTSGTGAATADHDIRRWVFNSEFARWSTRPIRAAAACPSPAPWP